MTELFIKRSTVLSYSDLLDRVSELAHDLNLPKNEHYEGTWENLGAKEGEIQYLVLHRKREYQVAIRFLGERSRITRENSELLEKLMEYCGANKIYFVDKSYFLIP